MDSDALLANEDNTAKNTLRQPNEHDQDEDDQETENQDQEDEWNEDELLEEEFDDNQVRLFFEFDFKDQELDGTEPSNLKRPRTNPDEDDELDDMPEEEEVNMNHLMCLRKKSRGRDWNVKLVIFRGRFY